jgi:hypothetical protein
MFRDMANNGRLSNSAKDIWTLAFIILNVFAAVIHYVTEYRRRY